MNEFEIPSSIELDRLVDGELSETQRRQVLLALDREECGESCGWRRLALAFVEAQSLRQDLRRTNFDQSVSDNCSPTIESTSSVVSPRQVNVPTPVVRRFSRIGIWQVVPLAVCCLLAFGLGRQSRTQTADTALAVKPVAPTISTFETDPTRTTDPVEIAATDPALSETQQTMHLVLDDLLGGAEQSVDVPVVNNSKIDPREFLDAPPSIPMALQHALRQRGHVVHEQRQLFEVELSDGRRGVVPISDVTVFNAGTDVFQ